MSNNYNPHPQGADEVNTVGALADGFANNAVNGTNVDDGSAAYVGGLSNGDNRDNTAVDVDTKVDVAADNGDNRDNSYDWNYDSKTITDTDVDMKSITDTDVKTVTDSHDVADSHNVSDSYNTASFDYDSKSYSNTDTDIKTTTDSFNTAVSEATNTSGSYNSTHSDFANLDDIKDVGNLGIAGGDLTFDIGDDFSFTLNVDSILNNSLNGEGNDSGFSAVQANHLADQDFAWQIRMDNAGANNYLSANAGTANGSEGIDMDGKGWDLKSGSDVAGTSTADASAILANSGFHLELVQGANLLTNSISSSVVGGDLHTTDIGHGDVHG